MRKFSYKEVAPKTYEIYFDGVKVNLAELIKDQFEQGEIKKS